MESLVQMGIRGAGKAVLKNLANLEMQLVNVLQGNHNLWGYHTYWTAIICLYSRQVLQVHA